MRKSPRGAKAAVEPSLAEVSDLMPLFASALRKGSITDEDARHLLDSQETSAKLLGQFTAYLAAPMIWEECPRFEVHDTRDIEELAAELPGYARDSDIRQFGSFHRPERWYYRLATIAKPIPPAVARQRWEAEGWRGATLRELLCLVLAHPKILKPCRELVAYGSPSSPGHGIFPSIYPEGRRHTMIGLASDEVNFIPYVMYGLLRRIRYE